MEHHPKHWTARLNENILKEEKENSSLFFNFIYKQVAGKDGRQRHEEFLVFTWIMGWFLQTDKNKKFCVILSACEIQ